MIRRIDTPEGKKGITVVKGHGRVYMVTVEQDDKDGKFRLSIRELTEDKSCSIEEMSYDKRDVRSSEVRSSSAITLE